MCRSRSWRWPGSSTIPPWMWRLSAPVGTSQLAALTPAASIELSAADLDTIEAILAGAAPVTGPAPEGM